MRQGRGGAAGQPQAHRPGGAKWALVWHGLHPTPFSYASCCCTADALSYLTTRLQSEFKVEVGATQPQRRAVAALVKPLGQPPQAGKQQ